MTSNVLEMKLHCWTVWIRVRLGHMTVSIVKMLESGVMSVSFICDAFKCGVFVCGRM